MQETSDFFAFKFPRRTEGVGRRLAFGTTSDVVPQDPLTHAVMDGGQELYLAGYHLSHLGWDQDSANWNVEEASVQVWTDHKLTVFAEPAPDTDLTADEFIKEEGLRSVVGDIKELARAVLGPDTQFSARLQPEPETGKDELIIEVRWPAQADSLDEVIAQDEALLRRLVEEIPSEARQKLSFVSTPFDADQT